MAGFGMILGGALKGVGTYGAGVREERLKQLAEDRADARNEREMQFRSQEAATARGAQVAENIRSEGVAASERQKDRDAQGNEVVTDAQGNTRILNTNTGKVIPVTGPDGKEFKLLPKATDSTAEIKNAEYMLKFGIAKNINEAWTKANRLADKDPSVIRDTMYRDWLRTLGSSGMDATEIDAEAKRMTNDYMREHYPDESAGNDPNKVANDPAHVDGATPSGAGTQDKPYRADTQNHVDWFKKNAKPGEWMIIDGTPYKK